MLCYTPCWQLFVSLPSVKRLHHPFPKRHFTTIHSQQDLEFSPGSNHWVLEDAGLALNLTAPLELLLRGASGEAAAPECMLLPGWGETEGALQQRCYLICTVCALWHAGTTLTATVPSLDSQPLTGVQFPLLPPSPLPIPELDSPSPPSLPAAGVAAAQVA